MKKGIKTKTLILITAALAAAALLVCVLIMNSNIERHIARVVSGDKLIREIDLDSVAGEYSFTVEYEGGYNVITVRNKEICVSDADCPDHICMNYGWIKGSGAPIVCMPHHLVISFEEDTEIDTVSR